MRGIGGNANHVLNPKPEELTTEDTKNTEVEGIIRESRGIALSGPRHSENAPVRLINPLLIDKILLGGGNHNPKKAVLL